MRIAIDISQIVYGTGVSTYTKQLVNNLQQLDSYNEYILFAGSLRRAAEIRRLYPSAKVFPLPPTLLDILWNRLHIFPIEKLIGNIDVLHTSDWTEPPSKAFKVTTVHDLAPFIYPELFPRDVIRNIVNTHKSKLMLTKKESNRIIVPTVSTKEDLVKMGFNPNIIRVIPEAVSSDYKRQDEKTIKFVKSKYNIRENYMLAVGMDPRKNTERIIRAFEHATAGKEIKLVLVGSPKYLNIKESRNLRILGYVASSDLPALYSGAQALLYPSLYEGFGLPILEAMACGCPVITSNLSSMAEVAGDAALFVDPLKVDSISDAIEKTLRGSKAIVEKGYRRVGEFSWQKTAQLTLDVYKEATK